MWLAIAALTLVFVTAAGGWVLGQSRGQNRGHALTTSPW
jgi:hypothetical protein